MHTRTPLYIYRYHSGDCVVHTLGLTKKAKKFYRDCDCPIWITGTTDDGAYQRRTTTGHRDWAAAEAELRSLQAHGKDITVHGPTIEDCAQRFLDGHSENVGDIRSNDTVGTGFNTALSLAMLSTNDFKSAGPSIRFRLVS